jgi:flagellar motor protein MotB
MRRLFVASLISLLTGIAGCGQNVMTLSRQNQTLAQQQQVVAQQNQELQRKADKLGSDNQELTSLLAQSRQQIQLLKDESTAVREQLRATNRQLADIRNQNKGLERHTEALAASVQRRAQATIHANNSLVGDLTVINLPGVEVRQDGDVVRIELPGGKLFHPGSAVLQPGATQFIDGVMADVLRSYPGQIIGIEGHTDADRIQTPQFPSNHHLSIARASTVYDHIVRRFQVSPRQFFLAGHGANHPVVSNATDSGKARNRRVEIVIYPEQVSR